MAALPSFPPSLPFPYGFFQDPTPPANGAPSEEPAPAALGPGCWLGIAQGHHILTAQPQTRVRIFQYRLLYILGLDEP